MVRSHYGNGFIKAIRPRPRAVEDGRRQPTMCTDYRVNKAVENLPRPREKQASINDTYQNIQQDILETFIDREQLRKLA